MDMATLLLVVRSAVASDYREPSFWRSCSLQAQRLLATVSLPDVAAFVEAAAACDYRDDELMLNVGDVALQRSGELDTDSLAAILKAHVTLRVADDRIVAQMQDLLYEHMQQSRATAGGLSSGLLSLARLHARGVLAEPHRELIAAASRMTTEHLSFFSTAQLCEVAEAFALFGMRGDQQVSALFLGIGSVLAREAGSLSSENCAAMLRSFAKCRVHDERMMTSIAAHFRRKDIRDGLTPQHVGDTLYGLAKFTCQDTALLDLLSVEARRRLHLMDVPLVGSVLASIAKTGVSSPVLCSRAVSKLKQTAPEDIDSATKEELGVIAMAFGKLQARDEKLFGIIADSFLRRTSPPLRQGSLVSLVNIVHAFTKVHVTHSKLFLAISGVLVERFNELSMAEAVKLMHGIGKVEYLPPPALQERLAEMVQSESIHSLGVFDLLKLATAAKRLGIRAPALEAHVGTVLPYESRGGDASLLGPGRRRAKPKRRVQSARKRKWTW